MGRSCPYGSVPDSGEIDSTKDFISQGIPGVPSFFPPLLELYWIFDLHYDKCLSHLLSIVNVALFLPITAIVPAASNSKAKINIPHSDSVGIWETSSSQRL